MLPRHYRGPYLCVKNINSQVQRLSYLSNQVINGHTVEVLYPHLCKQIKYTKIPCDGICIYRNVEIFAAH